MLTAIACLSLALFVSVIFNARQFLQRKIERKKPAPTIEAQDLLHDLLARGNAIVRIEVIDAANLLLRSPRG